MTWRRFFRRSRLDDEVARDLEFYIETETADNVARGMSAGEARAAARRKLGNPTFLREEVYRMNTASFFDTVWQDLALAARNLRRNPAFTLTAVLVLALGIGANAAMFSLFYRVLLRPLPYREPARLLSIGRELRGDAAGMISTQEFVGWRAESRMFDGLGAWGGEELNLTGAQAPERIVGANVSAGVLPLLGVQPAIGRGFTADDDKPGAAGVVLLTHELWMRRYGGKRSAVGETLVMNGAPYEIVGVLPAGFRFPSNVMIEALLPYQLPERPVWGGAGVILTEAMGRPRAGVSMEQALAELSAISARYQSQMPRFYFDPTRPSRITAISLQEKLVGKTRPALLALVWSVGILLLIACVNVANLQLARAAMRQREMGLRAALGASRARIVQWLGAEIAVVGGLACLVALAVAYGVLAVLRASNGVPVGDPAVFHGGWPLVTMTLAISAAAAVFAGVLPAFTAPGIELNEVLKSGALAVMGGRGVRTRSALVLIQVALALVLLIGSGVLLRSLQRVIAVNWGFRPERLLTAELRLPAMRYDTPAKQRAFTEALVERVGVLPEVESAATSSSLPLTRYLGSATILIEGQPVTQQVQRPGSAILVVSPGYFHTLGTPLLSGRQFNASDIAGAAPVAIVNSTFGRKFFPAGDAVGRRFLRGQSQRFTTIIGVTADMRQGGRESVVDTEVFVPVAQNPVRQVDLIVRARVDAASLAPSVRSAVWSVDKDQPIFAVSTMDDLIRRSGANRTLETLLLTCFGVLAMALAAIGIYGVVAETVGQRTREIGVRMALGAQSGDVLRMILGRCLVLAIGGVAVGAGAGFYLVRYLRTMVFGVEPRDAAAFAGAGLVLLAVAAIAGYLPARQAARIDPAVTLRCE